MSETEKTVTEEERRKYFRINDVISVVANPVQIDEKQTDEIAKVVSSARAISLSEGQNAGVEEYEGDGEQPDNKRLYQMINELKTKLDFLINHFMLDKEGLNKPEKKYVNISASGIRFTVDYAVKEGEILDIKLLLPTYPPVAVFAYGKVKRSISLENGRYDVALEYLNMSESVQNEIIQYAFAQQREAIRREKDK